MAKLPRRTAIKCCNIKSHQQYNPRICEHIRNRRFFSRLFFIIITKNSFVLLFVAKTLPSEKTKNIHEYSQHIAQILNPTFIITTTAIITVIITFDTTLVSLLFSSTE